jgi:hydrogenase-1 operon protein HyaE
MSSALFRALSERHGLPVVDPETIDAILAPAPGEPEAALLLFAGDPVRWPEADDVAVILPELIEAFPGELRGAVVARAAEEALKVRFGVVVFPSIVVVRAGAALATIAKVRDWADYRARIRAALDGDAPARAGAGPRTEIRFVGTRSDA